MPRRCGFRVRPVYRNPEGRFSESSPGPPDLRTTMITATATATNQQLQRRQPGVSTGSVPCTPLFDWHAPLVEWCGGRKIKIGVPGSIPVSVCFPFKSTHETTELTQSGVRLTSCPLVRFPGAPAYTVTRKEGSQKAFRDRLICGPQ